MRILFLSQRVPYPPNRGDKIPTYYYVRHLARQHEVTVACLAGMVWAIENPSRGIVEPDEMDFKRNLEICMPYLGPVVGQYTDWHPLHDRGRLFVEDVDATDPWQFKNVRVIS